MKTTKEYSDKKMAQFLCKTGMYTGYTVHDGTYWLTPAKSWWENEEIPLSLANRDYSIQCQVNKIDPKFCKKIYNIATITKDYISEYIYWEEFLNELKKILPGKAKEILDYIDEVYRNDNNYGHCLPPTRDLMLDLYNFLK